LVTRSGIFAVSLRPDERPRAACDRPRCRD
jgi:hypothetical protein